MTMVSQSSGAFIYYFLDFLCSPCHSFIPSLVPQAHSNPNTELVLEQTIWPMDQQLDVAYIFP